MQAMVLIPTYNERENISVLIPEILAVVPSLSILVIDDNSPDGTGELVRSLASTFPHLSLISRPRKEGLGAAYKEGLKRVLSSGDADPIILMDADGSHAPKYLPAMLAAARDHDLAVGSRYIAGGGIEKWEWWRYLLSRFGNVYARLLCGLPIKDLTSGYLCIRRAALSRIDLSRIEPSGYAFQIDLKYRLVKEAGARAVEIPIVFKSRREGESKISHHIIREGLRTPLKILHERLFHQ